MTYIGGRVIPTVDLGEIIYLYSGDFSRGDFEVELAMSQVKLEDGLFGRAIHRSADKEYDYGVLYWPNVKGYEESINEVLRRIAKETGVLECIDFEAGIIESSNDRYSLTLNKETKPKVYHSHGFLYDKKNLPKSKRNLIKANRKFSWWDLHKQEHIDNPEHLWERLLQSYTKIDPKLEGFRVDGKKAVKIYSCMCRLGAEFIRTFAMKGFSILFKEDDYAKIFDTFAYLTGKSPQPEEPEDAKPERVELTDPWDVDIPEIREVGR